MPAVDPHDLGRSLDGRFVDAVAYAARTHREQLRKGGDVPYLSHLLGVASLVLDFGGDEVQATVAILHDVAEDQGGQPRLDDIRMRFGDEVADLVEEMSDALPARGEDPGPWRPRKEAYVDDLHAAVTAGSPTVLVAACDKLDNVESVIAHATDPEAPHHEGASTDTVGFDVFEEYDDGPAGASWYYRTLLEVFEESDLPVRLLGRLRAAVGQLDALAEQAEHSGPANGRDTRPGSTGDDDATTEVDPGASREAASDGAPAAAPAADPEASEDRRPGAGAIPVGGSMTATTATTRSPQEPRVQQSPPDVDPAGQSSASPVPPGARPTDASPSPAPSEPVDTRPTGPRVFEVEGSPTTGERPSEESDWAAAVAEGVAGTGPARTLRLDFRVEESRRKAHIDDLVHPVLAGLREAAVVEQGVVALDAIHVTKAVGRPPGVTLHLDSPEPETWPPTPAVLDLRSANVPTVSRASRHHWALSVADAYEGTPLTGSAWVEVAVAGPRSLEGVMKPVIDSLEAVLGRDPSGPSDYLAPNDHLVTRMRVVRHPDLETAIRVRVGPID